MRRAVNLSAIVYLFILLLCYDRRAVIECILVAFVLSVKLKVKKKSRVLRKRLVID